MEGANVLDSIRADMELRMGQPVVVHAHRARRSSKVSRGVMEAVYPSIFTVAVGEGARLSFSYGDILTRSVELEWL